MTDWTPAQKIAEAATESVESAAPPAEKETPAELQPRDLWIDELHALTHRELLERAGLLRLRVNAEKSRHHLVCVPHAQSDTVPPVVQLPFVVSKPSV